MTASDDHDLVETLDHLVEPLGILRGWITGAHSTPIAPQFAAQAIEILDDLNVRLERLHQEPTLLTVVFVGGTGVGKSTLLNALAGTRIAEAGMVRPTTQTPTVYYPKSIGQKRLHPLLRECKLAAHERPELQDKILVDTPDMDSSNSEHWERLKRILPAADAVVYVGSQEKYHDRAVWAVLLAEKGSRGFAFVLNKWDRCLNAIHESTGIAPDVDFRASLNEVGFSDPLLFRTRAADWVQARQIEPAAGRKRRRRSKPTEGEEATEAPAIEDDFLKLEAWLQSGLEQILIRDIKTKGLLGRLNELLQLCERILPPDRSKSVASLRSTWKKAIQESIAEQVQTVAQSSDRHAAALARHFRNINRSQFHGPFRWYLWGIDFLPHASLSAFRLFTFEKDHGTQMATLANRCVADVPNVAWASHQVALRTRLLAQADEQNWPIDRVGGLLDQAESTRPLDQRQLAEMLGKGLAELEAQYANPSGAARAVRVTVKLLCDWLPYGVAAAIVAKWGYDNLFSGFLGAFTNGWGIGAYLSALFVLLTVILLLHWMVIRTFPVDWNVLRDRLRKWIEAELYGKLSPSHLAVLDQTFEQLDAERRTVVTALDSVRQVVGRIPKETKAEQFFPTT